MSFDINIVDENYVGWVIRSLHDRYEVWAHTKDWEYKMATCRTLQEAKDSIRAKVLQHYV